MDQPLAIAASLASAAALGVLSHGLFSPTSQLFAPVITRGTTSSISRRQVCLTFDDGPLPGSTDLILDQLKTSNIRAAFFVIGRYVQRHPDLLQRIHAEGHTIGNHTFDHHRAGLFRGTSYWQDQIRRTDDLIAKTTGAPPRFFRPPMGFKCPPLARAVRDTPTKSIIAWSRTGRDGVSTCPDRIVSRIQQTQPGDIILLHDGRDPASRRDVMTSVNALPRVLQSLDQKNLLPVSLEDLLAL